MSPGPNARPVSYSFEKPDLLQKTAPSPAPYINNPIISSQQMNNDGSETTNLSGIYLLCQKIDMTKNSSLQMGKVLSFAYLLPGYVNLVAFVRGNSNGKIFSHRQ